MLGRSQPPAIEPGLRDGWTRGLEKYPDVSSHIVRGVGRVGSSGLPVSYARCGTLARPVWKSDRIRAATPPPHCPPLCRCASARRVCARQQATTAPAAAGAIDVLAGEELLQQRPLLKLFDDGPRVRILSVLLDAEQPPNPTRIVERAEIGERSWYNHKDPLLETGLVVEAGHAGNSPLYAIPDRGDDVRVEWLEKLRDWTGAYIRDGTRPAPADAE